MLYLTGQVNNGCELTGMEVDGDEEQHLSKTDPTDALSSPVYVLLPTATYMPYLFPIFSGVNG